MHPIDHRLAERLPLRVLVVEDDPINQRVVTAFLAHMGYQPDVATNGIEALDAVQRAAYDFVLMDIQMPKMDGLETTRRLRQQEAERPDWAERSSLIIVALTTHTSPADRARCEAAGMDDFIAKPLRVQSLQAAIEKWGAVILNSASAGKPEVIPPEMPSSDENPPVSLDQIHEFTEGDPQAFRELVELYLQQTDKKLEEIQTAIQTGQSSDLEHLAHSSAGASASCGMQAIVPALRRLEQLGREGRWEGATGLHAEALRQFGRIREFLDLYRNSPPS